MLELLRRLLIGHAHKWEIINEISGKCVNPLGGVGPCILYTLRCTECGAIKKKMIR
jgi:hypothetical protein